MVVPEKAYDKPFIIEREVAKVEEPKVEVPKVEEPKAEEPDEFKEDPSSLVIECEDVPDKVLEESVEDKKPNASQEVSQSMNAQISYLERLDKENVPLFRENMINLMEMGFDNFEKNLDMLRKMNNDLNMVIGQLFEG